MPDLPHLIFGQYPYEHAITLGEKGTSTMPQTHETLNELKLAAIHDLIGSAMMVVPYARKSGESVAAERRYDELVQRMHRDTLCVLRLMLPDQRFGIEDAADFLSLVMKNECKKIERETHES